MKDAMDTCSEGPDESPGIRSLAESALRILAERKQGARAADRHDWVERLCDAVVSDSETSHHRVISSMVSSGITSDDVFDIYLPAVARELGERWVRDEAGFVQVTLGTGRLQALIRERAGVGAGGADGTGRVLMVLPPFEAHALGVFIAADQIRRAGHAVHVSVGPEPSELARMLEDRDFDMVGLTCATRRAIGRLRDYIHEVRSAVSTAPPLVVGGPLVPQVRDLAEICGADHAAETCEAALRACGLVSATESLCI